MDRINQKTPAIAVEVTEAAARYMGRQPKPGLPPGQFDRHAGFELALACPRPGRDDGREGRAPHSATAYEDHAAQSGGGRPDDLIDTKVQFIDDWKRLRPLQPLAERSPGAAAAEVKEAPLDADHRR